MSELTTRQAAALLLLAAGSLHRIRAGYSDGGSTVVPVGTIKALTSKGLVDVPPARAQLTKRGRAMAKLLQRLATGSSQRPF